MIQIIFYRASAIYILEPDPYDFSLIHQACRFCSDYSRYFNSRDNAQQQQQQQQQRQQRKKIGCQASKVQLRVRYACLCLCFIHYSEKFCGCALFCLTFSAR